MKAFHAVRQHAAKKGWPATFVTSGKYASCFIELPPHPKLDDVLLQTHGTRQEAGLAMRKHLLALGLLQRGPGAPKGNANASAKNRSKKVSHKRLRKALGTLNDSLKKLIIKADIRDENVYSAPLVINDNMLLTSYLESNVGLYGGPVGETLEEANLRVAQESLSKADMVVAKAKPINGTHSAMALLRPYQKAALERIKADFKKAEGRAGQPKGLLETAIEATTKRPGAPKKGSAEEMQEIQNRVNAQVLKDNPAMLARIKTDVAKRTVDGVVMKKIVMKPALPAKYLPSRGGAKEPERKIDLPPKRSHHKKKA